MCELVLKCLCDKVGDLKYYEPLCDFVYNNVNETRNDSSGEKIETSLTIFPVGTTWTSVLARIESKSNRRSDNCNKILFC